MKILIIEDEKELASSIKTYLEPEDYLCEIASTYFDAELKLNDHSYDIVLLDITLPGGNGLDLMDLLKKESPDTGIVIISAKNSLDDKLKGLDLGADDYLTKPFHLSELNSRIRALLRRKVFRGQTNLKHHEIDIFPESGEARIHGKNLQLTKKEFSLLLFFVTNKNRVLTRENIAEHLWGENADMADNFDFIYTHIRNLRRKIEEAGGTDYLQSVYGLGYKFIGE